MTKKNKNTKIKTKFKIPKFTSIYDPLDLNFVEVGKKKSFLILNDEARGTEFLGSFLIEENNIVFYLQRTLEYCEAKLERNTALFIERKLPYSLKSFFSNFCHVMMDHEFSHLVSHNNVDKGNTPQFINKQNRDINIQDTEMIYKLEELTTHWALVMDKVWRSPTYIDFQKEVMQECMKWFKQQRPNEK